MCRLSLKEIEILNYRKFSDKTFVLNPGMNIFAGKNGSGKTAVLEACNVILGAYLSAFKTYVPSRYVFNISKNDVHQKTQGSKDKTLLTTGGVAQYPCKIACKMEWNEKNNTIEFLRVLLKENGRTKFDGTNPMQTEVVEWERKIAQADHKDEDLIFPLVLYLSSARLWNENNSMNENNGVYGRTDAYSRCLDARHGMELVFSYINQLQSVAMEENNGKHFPAYDALLTAVNEALKDEIADNEKVIFSTRYGKDIVALKTSEGTVIPFTNLSDGYRNVIRIVLDIATRMCILNPYLGGNALTETPGIVIIDELDLSLHPTWQKRIVTILKTLFPKIQFICATHSPFIIQSLENGELFTLDGREKPDGDAYSGESIEDIAEDVMGVEMPQYSEKKIKMLEAAEAFYKALDEAVSSDELEKLRINMVVLEAEFSDNPAYLALIRQEYKAKELELKK